MKRLQNESGVRIVFLGNHTAGVKALEAISQTEEVSGVIAHLPDPEDGVRYRSVYDFAVQHGWRVMRCTGQDPALADFIRGVRPDLLWITDYRYLLPPPVISVAPLGAINLHPSLLPRYRGRAPINWAILNGETTLGLTAHVVDEGMDTGDIIEQVSFELREDQDVGDALEMLYPLYFKITRQVLDSLKSAQVPRRPQDHSKATFFPRRKPEDGLIDWHEPARGIWNLIRGVAFPYPGAFTTVEGCKLIIWKAHLSTLSISTNHAVGEILNVTRDEIHIQCKDNVLILKRIEFAARGKSLTIRPGMLLGT